MGEQQFLADTIHKAAENNISFKLINQRSHKGCGGFFDQKNLVCCIKSPRRLWLGTLCHEACHMDQFLENEPTYLSNYKNHASPAKQMRATLAMELDCEERSINKIIRYGLPIYLEEYYQMGNCYLASHYYFHKFKCFYHPKHSPYRNPELLAMFPDDQYLSFDELWRPNKKLGDFLKQWNKPN